MSLLFVNLSFASGVFDISIKDNRIFYKGVELRPGCLRVLSTQLNGDSVSLVVNVEFEKVAGQFVGRGCMSANQYQQTTFERDGYLSYLDDEKKLKDVLKDPLLRFDGFGYKLAKKIDEKVLAIDVREFTTGSADFLTTIVVEVVENTVFTVSPEGKAVSTKAIGIKRIGEVLKGTLNLNEKLNDALKLRRIEEKKRKKHQSI